MNGEQKLANEAEDIFADVEDTATMTVMSGNSEQVTTPVIMDQHPMHRRMIWLGAIVVLLIVGGLGYYGYNKWFAKVPTVEVPKTDVVKEKKVKKQKDVVTDADVVEKTTTTTSTTTEKNIPKPIINKQMITDTDNDGLTDEEEKLLGTNPNEPDTDGDGLYDREEIKVYKTNPLNPDTDGDGFTDGQEVKGGYNPAGTGKLFEFNIKQ